MSFKLLIKCFLWFQLFLLIFRQIIDFCGIQWLMILVNAFAIIFTISALFNYYIFYALFQILLIVYNIIVLLFYFDFISNKKLLSFDLNSKSFWFQIIQQNFDLNNEINYESIVNYIEIIQSIIHLILSLILFILIIIHLQRERKIRLKENSKTTPPLPPYTISPLNSNTHYLSSTMNSNRSSRRKRTRDNSKRNHSLRRNSNQRTRAQQSSKLISNQYSDSETDFYQTYYGLNLTSNNGLTNPLYCNRNSFSNNETTI